ncbi:MAG: ATP-dependent DNA helicase RecG [Chlorobi bacterium OLB5]|nr:MAG: ATP-dependent DNA helicase RecG [Chlorobi bacterium OLB5]
MQGDVGSGKTIVAVFCMLAAAESGYQAAFMAPTEILAEQHYKTLSDYFNKLGIHSVILTGSIKNKDRGKIVDDIKTGKAKIIVGTHALIQDKVEFNSLGLAVIDEQHKFGVLQRAKLRSKGNNPDILVMTATPIPRTLSLTVYGELDVSVIDELPSHRKNIKTALRGEFDRIKVYDFVRKEIRAGRQAYIVYPIIDESEKLDLKSAIKHYEILKDGVFSDLKLGLVHGRMPWKEIDETIAAFKSRTLDILVATTVIEVGIDIPNATIMIIEEAQRFGLSQLHQLRGRVGRGAEQSYCILMAAESGNISSERLKIMTETNDGFKISETDLKIRGPGEFFGTRQSGDLKFSAADLAKDTDLILKAKESAFKVIKEDPQLRSYHNDVIREHFLKNYRTSFDLIKVA